MPGRKTKTLPLSDKVMPPSFSALLLTQKYMYAYSVNKQLHPCLFTSSKSSKSYNTLALPGIFALHFIKALDETDGKTVHICWDVWVAWMCWFRLKQTQNSDTIDLASRQRTVPAATIYSLNYLPYTETGGGGHPGRNLQWHRMSLPLQTHRLGSVCHE